MPKDNEVGFCLTQNNNQLTPSANPSPCGEGRGALKSDILVYQGEAENINLH